jgi:hypothetical protein
MFLMMSGAASADPQDKVIRCWSPPAGAVETEVEVRFQIDEDGALIDIPSSPQADSKDSKDIAAAEAAIRAVRRCAPYQIPAGAYRVFFPYPEPMPDRA